MEGRQDGQETIPIKFIKIIQVDKLYENSLRMKIILSIYIFFMLIMHLHAQYDSMAYLCDLKADTSNITDSLKTCFYENGLRKSELIFKNNKLIKLLNFWDSTGQQVVKNGEGCIITLYEDGMFSKDSISNGIINMYMLFHPNQTMKMAVPYKNGEIHGQIKTYCENSTLLSIENFQDGKREGIRKEWYDNGQLKLDANYLQGTLSGSYCAYFRNGIIQKKCTYNKGSIDGIYIENYENGNSKIKGTYTCYPDKIEIDTSIIINVMLDSLPSLNYSDSISNREIVSINYLRCAKTGTWWYYYDTGEIRSTGNYYPSAIIMHYRYFINGLQTDLSLYFSFRIGLWKMYTIEGKEQATYYENTSPEFGYYLQ